MLAGRRRARPHAGRQQQRLLPRHAAHLAALGRRLAVGRRREADRAARSQPVLRRMRFLVGDRGDGSRSTSAGSRPDGSGWTTSGRRTMSARSACTSTAAAPTRPATPAAGFHADDAADAVHAAGRPFTVLLDTGDDGRAGRRPASPSTSARGQSCPARRVRASAVPRGRRAAVAPIRSVALPGGAERALEPAPARPPPPPARARRRTARRRRRPPPTATSAGSRPPSATSARTATGAPRHRHRRPRCGRRRRPATRRHALPVGREPARAGMVVGRQAPRLGGGRRIQVAHVVAQHPRGAAGRREHRDGVPHHLQPGRRSP